jgi:hypothetical protein
VDIVIEPSPAWAAPAAPWADQLTAAWAGQPAAAPAARPAELVAAVAAGAAGWRPLDGAGPHAGGWSLTLLRTATVEVALIGWAPGQATRAHDHGGAAGAWAVLAGELVEDHFADLSWSARPRRTRVGPGVVVDSDPERVHVVANPGPEVAVVVQARTPSLRAVRQPLVGAASILAEAAPWLAAAVPAPVRAR